MSIRGLDQKTLDRLKKQAHREGGSLNSLVLRILQGQDGAPPKESRLRPRRDFGALAGTWTAAEARAFERATADFGKVDPELWK